VKYSKYGMVYINRVLKKLGPEDKLSQGCHFSDFGPESPETELCLPTLVGFV